MPPTGARSWVKLKLRSGLSIALMTFGLATNSKRVAVRRRLHDRFGGDLLAGGAAVLDHEGLAEPLRRAFVRSAAR